MTRREVATLGFRLAGIYVAVQAILLLPLFGATLRYLVSGESGLRSADGWIVGASFALSGSALSILAMLLIRRADRFAAKLFPDWLAPEMPRAPVTVEPVFCAVIGLALIAYALPACLRETATAIVTRDQLSLYLHDAWPDIVGEAAQLILGLWLFIAPRTVVGWWRADAGTPP